jgi:hypothetical protein
MLKQGVQDKTNEYHRTMEGGGGACAILRSHRICWLVGVWHLLLLLAFAETGVVVV